MLATYNEKENIKPMIETLEKIAKENPKYDFVNLVVDSHSPDGTGEMVKAMAEKQKNLFLLETPRGLGVSLINGYQYAVKELKADVVIPNDCDFQWDPLLIPEMLKKIDEGYDVVVASRHTKGAKDSFTGFRKLTHFVSNTLFNYYWAGIHEAKDLAGNFKAIKVKDILDKVDLKRLNVRGFVIQSTMIYELSKTGAKFIEVPATFKDRRAGASKVGFNIQFVKDIFETIKNSTRIRLERSQRFVKYATVGFISYAITAIFMELFYRLGLTPGVASSAASEISIIFNFIVNNLWTFKDKKITSFKQVPVKFIQFNFTSLGAVILQGLVVGGLALLFGDKWRQIYLIFAVGFVVVPFNYTMYNVFIWKTWKLPKIFK